MIKSAPYYWLECDGCGYEPGDHESDGPELWPNAGSLVTYRVSDGEWTTDGTRHHCPDCPPLDTLGVGLVRWTGYRTQSDWRADRDGRQVEGQFVSAAPGGKWAVTTDQKFHLVKTYNGKSYSISGSVPVPP